MKKGLIVFLIVPVLMATQCEDDIECTSETLIKTKQNLLTIENSQTTYQVGDVLWIKSDLDRNINFDTPNETIDLFDYSELIFKFNFDRISIYNSEMYLCVNEDTIEIVKGELLNCNQFSYERSDTNFQSNIGIKLLEAGEYRMKISEISSNEHSDCSKDGIVILTSFSNNDNEWVTFLVQ